MESPDPSRSEQVRLSTVLLATLCLTCMVVVLLAHATPILPNHVAREVARHRATNGMYLFDDGYLDAGDYVLLGQIPNDDYSRGGVYFIGASETLTGFMPQLLSAEERQWIHDYAIGDLRIGEARHFLRMLVTECGLLKAGAGKTTVILGLSYPMGRRRNFDHPLHRYVMELFRRHRLYIYDRNSGAVHVAPISAAERFLHIQRDYAHRFLHVLFLAPSHIVLSDQPDKREHLESIMGAHWQQEMQAGVEELDGLIDDLQRLGVHVRAVLPPNGSWQHALPYDAAYREMVLPALERRGVPVEDQGSVLADEEFGDAVHARYRGHLKLHRLNHELALRSLDAMGIPRPMASSR